MPTARSLAGGEAWKCSIQDAPDWTCIRRRWSLAFASAGCGKVEQEVRTFGTTTTQLLALAGWLSEHGCTHVAMEATGVYWKPVWHVLEEAVRTGAGQRDAHQERARRKTDVNDATWLSDLLAHGLIRASFVPDGRPRRCGTCCAPASSWCANAASHMQRHPEDAGGRQHQARFGHHRYPRQVSGRAILDALVAGQTDPEALATPGRLPHQAPRRTELREALRGRMTPTIASCSGCTSIRSMRSTRPSPEIDKEVDATSSPFASLEIVDDDPRRQRLPPQVSVSEIGIDMAAFPTAAI